MDTFTKLMLLAGVLLLVLGAIGYAIMKLDQTKAAKFWDDSKAKAELELEKELKTTYRIVLYLRGSDSLYKLKPMQAVMRNTIFNKSLYVVSSKSMCKNAVDSAFKRGYFRGNKDVLIPIHTIDYVDIALVE